MTVPHITAGADANAPTLNAVISAINTEISNIVDGSTSLTSPTIASFALAQHGHEDSAGGGSISIDALTAPIADDGKALVISGGQIVAVSAGGVPAGCILVWGSTESLIPSGWLLCFGQSLARTTYATLFAAIGTTYGSPNNSTFNLPDLRGRVPVGVDAMGGSPAGRVSSNAQLGNSSGEDEVTLTTAQLASHSHGAWSHGSSGVDSGVRGIINNILQPSTTTELFSEGTSPIFDNGSGNAHTNMPPYLCMNWIIKT